MTTMDIFSIVLMGLASILCIVLIFFVVRLARTVKNADDSIKEINRQLRPITSSLTGISEKLNGIAAEIRVPLDATIDVFMQLKERVDLVLKVEENIRDTVITQISAVFNGVKSFAQVYKGNGHLPKFRPIFRS